MSVGTSLAPTLQELSKRLRSRGLRLAVAESCTGGLLAACLADMPESTDCYLGGVVTYTKEAKRRALGVPEGVLAEHGAVSGEAAEWMARAVRERFGVDLGVSITGVSGPAGEEGKPVGLTYLGLSADGLSLSRRHRFHGGRAANQVSAVEAALELALDFCSDERPG